MALRKGFAGEKEIMREEERSGEKRRGRMGRRGRNNLVRGVYSLHGLYNVPLLELYTDCTLGL